MIIKSFPEVKKTPSIVDAGYDEEHFGENYWLARNIKGNRRIDRDAFSLKEFVKALRQHKILVDDPQICDVGCGPGNMVMDFRREGYDCFGCEFSRAAIRIGKQEFNLDIPFCDLRGTIPFKDDRFDFAYCVGVMTMIPVKSVMNAFREMRRILKPGGLLHILLINPVMVGPRAGNEPHLTSLEYNDWRGMAIEAGLEDVTSLWAAQRHGIGMNNEFCALFRK